MNKVSLWTQTKAWAFKLLKVAAYRFRVLPHPYQLYSAIKIYEFETVAAHLRLPTAGMLVDVCCGTGIQTQLFTRQVRRIIGIDSDYNKIRDAYWHLRHSRFHDSVFFLVGRAESLPLPDNVADGVTCLCAIEHISNPEAALAEVNRILKPGGVLCITADSLANVMCDNLRIRHQQMYGVFHYFDVKSLSNILQNAGFRVEIAFPMLCSPEAVKELERCMVDPSPYGAVRTRRLLLKLREGQAARTIGPGGVFVFAAATKRTVGGVVE